MIYKREEMCRTHKGKTEEKRMRENEGWMPTYERRM